MANRNDDQAPQVAHTSYPEALPNQQYSYNNQHNQYPPHTSLKPDEQGGVPYSTYTGSHVDPNSPGPSHAVLAGGTPEKKSKGGICGCSVLVFVLSVIIALLSAAVIGLAAGTGIEAGRANGAEVKLAQLSSSLTATGTATSSSATSTATSFAAIDNNCSEDPDGVTGTTYDAFSLYGNYSFKIECNKDAAGTPLISLFAADFDTCMDQCAAYNQYMPAHFGDYSSNSTCGGVSFIPLWTTKSEALKGGAPGNCYLKPNQTESATDPNIGTECHAGIWNIS